MQTSGLLRPLSRSTGCRSGYVCLQCRQRTGALFIPPRTLPASPSGHRNASTSEDKAGYFSAEKFRRKLWGTDNPPGQADPYGKESLVDKVRQAKELEELRASELAAPTAQSERPVNPEVDYVPAVTWDGLDQIGGATGWWEEAWDEEHQFKGFMPATVLDSNDEIRKAVYQAVNETHPLKRRERPSRGASRTAPKLNSDTSNGATIGPEIPDANKSSISADSSTTRPINLSDDNWLNTSLQDPAVKFAVLKRVMQLTGKWIPDSTISKISFVRNIMEHLTEAPKPKKLAEELLSKPLATMPNVEILDHRYTPIDKEKEVGRWKVIERELRKRDLPVTGRA